MQNGELRYHIEQVYGLKSPELIDSFDKELKRRELINAYKTIEQFILYLNRNINVDAARKQYISKANMIKHNYVQCIMNNNDLKKTYVKTR